MTDHVGGSPVEPRPSHRELIEDQFSRQAELFARAPALHNSAVLELLVEAAEPRPGDLALDVACGPGTVVTAFAAHVRRAVGLDATAAMLQQARDLAAKHAVTNAEWHRGDVYRLPFARAAFDIVSCRFAFHHLEDPARAFAEMARVCRDGGRIVLCDGLASDDPAKAEAFNRMERFRDPSTVAFRPLAFLVDLFAEAGLAVSTTRFFRVPAELDRMIALSFPLNDDRDGLRLMIESSVGGDTMAMNARREAGTVRLSYPSVVLVARKPAAAPD